MDRATRQANQMLALATVEQLRQQGDPPALNWADSVREVALDLAPLIADAGLDFALATVSARVLGHAWALRELTRNLLHDVIKHSPAGGRLMITLKRDGRHATLTLADSGAGIADTLRPGQMQPFSGGTIGDSGRDSGHASGDDAGARRGASAGLGLAICCEIVATLGGSLTLVNRLQLGHITGLDATVQLPLAHNPPP